MSAPGFVSRFSGARGRMFSGSVARSGNRLLAVRVISLSGRFRFGTEERAGQQFQKRGHLLEALHNFLYFAHGAQNSLNSAHTVEYGFQLSPVYIASPRERTLLKRKRGRSRTKHHGSSPRIISAVRRLFPRAHSRIRSEAARKCTFTVDRHNRMMFVQWLHNPFMIYLCVTLCGRQMFRLDYCPAFLDFCRSLSN